MVQIRVRGEGCAAARSVMDKAFAFQSDEWGSIPGQTTYIFNKRFSYFKTLGLGEYSNLVRVWVWSWLDKKTLTL